MDTLAIIIVTAFLNIMISSIVTNLIFYRKQKDIELSFAKKLDEFKANLQKSLLEHQTKFVRNHQKRIEALESLHSKYILFEQHFYKALIRLENDSKAPVPLP
jgi:hypothetical protein